MAKSGGRQLIAESDDLLFCYDCDANRVTDCRIKAEEADMTMTEREWVDALQRGRQVSRVRYRKQIEHLSREFKLQTDLMRVCAF